MKGRGFLGFWVVLMFVMNCFVLVAQDEKAQMDSLFERLRANEWRIDVDRVSSASAPNTERFNPRGFMEMNDSIVKGDLPFFGKAYNVPYGDKDGVMFDGKAEGVKLEQKKKSVNMRFEVNGKGDRYRFYITFFAGGQVQIQMNSNQREAATYSGSYSFFNDKINGKD